MTARVWNPSRFASSAIRAEWLISPAGTFALGATLMRRRHSSQPVRREWQWSFVMAQVITKCPLTGHYMFMGIDIDEERFAALPEFFARQFCPFCACEHSWLKKDSKLVDRRRAMRRGVQQAS